MPFPEIVYSFKWWLAVSLAGWAAWPAAAHLLRGLPDRGWSLSRALGLLLAGYAFWMLTTLGFTRNDAGGILVAFALLAGLSAWAAGREGRGNLIAWLREQWGVALGFEVLFLAAFAAWVVVRAHNPQLMSAGGEKWMEYAFLNAIQRSPSFPPMDPWLSGFAISYYYFGYVVVAALATVTGVPLSHGFNLGVAMLFALSALGVTGIVFNLMALWGRGHDSPDVSGRTVRRYILPALLGAMFLLGIGNFEGVWEAVHAKGWGSPAFWKWLDIENLEKANVTGTFQPGDYFWWWRASRTLNDRDWITGGHVEVIDEFPFFSFMLGDMHPHVLALPFAFLAMGFGLGLCVAASPARFRGLHLPLDPPRLLLGMLVLGGLSFLNTWDFPIYLFVVTAAYAAGRAREFGWNAPVWRSAGGLGLALAVGGVLLYLPFYAGFSSQASGILPNLAFPTKFQQFFTMFGPLLLLLGPALAWMLFSEERAARWRWFFGALLASTLGLFILSILLGAMMMLFPGGRGMIDGLLAPSGLSWGQAATILLKNRLVHSATTLALGLMIAAVVALLFPGRQSPPTDEVGDDGSSGDSPNPATQSIMVRPSVIFALVLAGTGALLALGPEFVYLRDGFGTRMNTVFKFYFQAWAMWAAAGAFGVWFVFQYAGSAVRFLAGLSLVLAVALGAVYPALALPAKTNNFQGAPTLDSTLEFALSNPDDHAGIQWVRENLRPGETILEAVGGSYTSFGRVSAFSGHPTVLGWPGHEVQWRGGADDWGGRESDVRGIYTLRDWTTVESLLDRYDVDYVYVGPMERSQYGPGVDRLFERNLQPVYRNGGVTIYAREPVAASR